MAKRIRLLSFAGGLMQTLVALSILFLPVFVTCYLNESTCRYQSYIQLGGNFLGYTLLTLMLLLGLLVIGISFSRNLTLQHLVFWIAAISSFVTVIVGSWSFGFTFLPGGVLLLITAIYSGKQ